MKLESNEYRVKEMDGVQTITITLDALKKWSELYYNKASQIHLEDGSAEIADIFDRDFYMGKVSVIVDLLEHFEEYALSNDGVH